MSRFDQLPAAKLRVFTELCWMADIGAQSRHESYLRQIKEFVSSEAFKRRSRLSVTKLQPWGGLNMVWTALKAFLVHL